MKTAQETLNGTYLELLRAGKVGIGIVNGKTGLNAGVVLTDAGFLVAIPEGKRIMVPAFYVVLTTVTDTADFEVGYTSNADGSGDFTAISPKFHYATGITEVGIAPVVTAAPIPLSTEYGTTAKALTFRVTTNDAAASVNIGYIYAIEDI